MVNKEVDRNKCDDNKNIKFKRYKPYKEEDLVPVGFCCQEEEPTDKEICNMVDQAIYQVLGREGLAAIVKPGDKVVLKVNLVGTSVGLRGQKNRSGITDARIVRYVAEKVREIIGYAGPADLKVVDATFYKDKNPSLKESDLDVSFYWARLERTGDNAVDEKDVCYDGDGDGILDGGSYARLINLDSQLEDERYVTKVEVASQEEVTVCLPKLLRTREEAEAEGSDEYCDVLVGLPILKSHAITGMTGALKLHYGFRHYENMKGDTGRFGHSGISFEADGIHNKERLLDYLSAEHIVRDYDFVIMDCLTGNRTGPMNERSSLIFNNHAKNYPFDYILTNAVLASKDSVAIDTVATVLAGYDPKSIDLLENARKNGLGTNNPRYIKVCGFSNFNAHRIYLYQKYSPDRYPFKEGWGGAKLLPNSDFEVQIKSEKPEEVSQGTYAISYSIKSAYDVPLDLARVELWVNSKLVDYRNEGELRQGKLVFNLNKAGLPKKTYLDFIIVALDKNFNYRQSGEVIYLFN